MDTVMERKTQESVTDFFKRAPNSQKYTKSQCPWKSFPPIRIFLYVQDRVGQNSPGFGDETPFIHDVDKITGSLFIHLVSSK